MRIFAFLLMLLMAFMPSAKADVPVAASVQTIVNMGSGDFAPYYVASNRHGVLTQASDALVRADMEREWNTSERFSWGAGLSLIGGIGTDVTYRRYSSDKWINNPCGPSNFWLQQCYGEVKWRNVFATAGMKERGSALLNSRLSSGDVVESGNCRPIPEVRIGFVDFCDIPFTKGALQIEGVISYGKFTDNGWLKDHYNYFNYHLNSDEFYTYKRCYFRTDPRQPLSVTFGMQSGGEFGGKVVYYKHGAFQKEESLSSSPRTFLRLLFPVENSKTYYEGSSLGSWDVKVRYRLRSGAEVSAYMQKLWEDGSGIGMLNGFDGLWGVEFKAPRKGYVDGVVVEYLDFTNQSGPMHWDYVDEANADIPMHADGADNYYNNHQSRSYANYGMSIGSPFLRSPLYNLNGSLQFLHTRCRGFHVGVDGNLSQSLSYRLLGGYRKSWGNGRIPVYRPLHDTSMMAEFNYRVKSHLDIQGQLAFDSGTLYGNNVGCCLTLKYSANFTFGKK